MAAAFSRAGIRWWAGPGTAASGTPLPEILDEVVRRFRSGELEDLKHDARKQMMRLTTAGGDDLLLKTRSYRGSQRLRRRWQGSKARRELVLVGRVLDAGVATPRPLAVGEEGSWLGLERDFVLLPFVKGARDLRHVASTEAQPERRRALAAALGVCTRRLEQAGIFQEDFAPNNFLVCEGEPVEAIQAIDFERAQLRRVDQREIVFSLVKLLRELPSAAALERRALVRALRPVPAEARHLWQQVAAALPRQALVDLARLERVVAREGRRFRRLEGNGETILVRRSLEAVELEGWLREPGSGVSCKLGGAGLAALARSLATAELLAHRQLGPSPLLAVSGAGRSWIGFSPPAQPARPRPEAVTALLRGLLAIGRLPEPPGPEALIGAQGGRQALLLDPGKIELGTRVEHPSRVLREWGRRF